MQRTSMTIAAGDDRHGRLAGARRVLLGRPELQGGMLVTAFVLRLAGAGLLGWIGYIHWHLWQLGYSDIPTDGPFFLIDAIAGVVLAVLLLAWPRALAGLLSAGFVASTILALVISLSVGLFGFHEQIQAAYVVQSLVLESVAVLLLGAWTVIAAAAVPSSPGPVGQPGPAATR